MQGRQNKELIHHFSLEVQPSHVMLTWVDECHHSKHPPTLLLPSALGANTDTIWCGISPGSLGVSCPSCDPSQILVHPSPPRWWDGVGSRKELNSVQALLRNIKNIPVLPRLFPALTQNAAPYQLLWRQVPAKTCILSTVSSTFPFPPHAIQVKIHKSRQRDKLPIPTVRWSLKMLNTTVSDRKKPSHIY